jgi:hypothetical protein
MYQRHSLCTPLRLPQNMILLDKPCTPSSYSHLQYQNMTLSDNPYIPQNLQQNIFLPRNSSMPSYLQEKLFLPHIACMRPR